jgi:hypothetical protein
MHVLLLVLALLILWPITHGVTVFIGGMLLFALRSWVFVLALIVVAVSWPSITSERERSRAASWREESGATAATLAVETAPEAEVDIPGEAIRIFGSTRVEETGGWPVVPQGVLPPGAAAQDAPAGTTPASGPTHGSEFASALGSHALGPTPTDCPVDPCGPPAGVDDP